jgi:hypothetical protein
MTLRTKDLDVSLRTKDLDVYRLLTAEGLVVEMVEL